jgi:hypothetical protein
MLKTTNKPRKATIGTTEDRTVGIAAEAAVTNKKAGGLQESITPIADEYLYNESTSLEKLGGIGSLERRLWTWEKAHQGFSRTCVASFRPALP